MRNAFKWPMLLACAVALATSIAACGGGSGSTAESSSPGGSSEEINGTVEIWDSEYNSIPRYTEAVDQLDAEFERLHPAVKVKRVPEPNPGFESIYRAAFTARQGPDVMVFQPGAFGVLSFKQGLEVLNPYISEELQEQLIGWETTTDGYTTDGDHYGIPIGANGFVVYYNKKLFAKAGLPTEFQPKTWAEVREAGEKLEAAEIQPFGGGNKEGNESLFWFTMGFESENTPKQTVELGNGEMPYTDEAVAKAFGPLVEMQEAGLLPANFYTTPWLPDGLSPFLNGEAGMTAGLWSAAAYYGEFNPAIGEKNVGFFYPPGAENPATLANNAYGIPKFAKNKEAAWALLEYMASKKGVEVLNHVGGLIPTRKDVSVPAGAPVQERELAEALRDSEPTPAALAVIPSTVAYGPLTEGMNQALQGRTSVADVQEEMQEAADRVTE